MLFVEWPSAYGSACAFGDRPQCSQSDQLGLLVACPLRCAKVAIGHLPRGIKKRPSPGTVLFVSVDCAPHFSSTYNPNPYAHLSLTAGRPCQLLIRNAFI